MTESMEPGRSRTSPDPSGGDSAEFERLVTPLLESAYRTAFRFTRNGADAEDLVHDAVLLACRGFAGFLPGTNFRAWFFRILANAFFSRHRQERRRGTSVELDDTPELYLFSQTASIGLHSRVADPAAELMNRLDAELVGLALEDLPEEYRVVAALYFGNDMTYEDIATSLGIPVGTVRSRLHRARRLLQRALWRAAVEHGIVAALDPEPR